MNKLPSKLRQLNVQTVVLVLSITILIIVTLYTAWYANLTNVTNSDDLIYPYLFDKFQFHDLIIPGPHANILKFPIFVLQSAIPYNLITLTIVNIGLVFVTVLGWAGLLIYLFSKRLAPIICVGFSAVMISSSLLDHELLGTTIRNIEYPLALLFIIAIGLFLKTKLLTKRHYIFITLVSLAYAVMAAGDSLFLYAVTVPMLIMIFLYWIVSSGRINHRIISTIGILVTVTVVSSLIQKIVSYTGIATLFGNPFDNAKSIALDHLGPSIVLAFNQFLSLFGANIFSQPLKLSNSLVFLNFTLLVVGLVGLVCMFVHAIKSFRKTDAINQKNYFVFGTLALSFLATFSVYIFLDLVIRVDSDGSLVTAHQDRYLTLLPLLILIGLAYIVYTYFKTRHIVLLIGVVLVVTLISLNPINSGRKLDYSQYGLAIKNSLNSVASIAKDNDVDLIVSGYWYGASTKFYSANTLSFAPIAGCNIPSPDFNVRKSWYVPAQDVKTSALVIDRTGIDKDYWLCSDEQLYAIYGMPDNTLGAQGINGNSLKLLIYSYDVRTKFLPRAN